MLRASVEAVVSKRCPSTLETLSILLFEPCNCTEVGELSRSGRQLLVAVTCVRGETPAGLGTAAAGLCVGRWV